MKSASQQHQLSSSSSSYQISALSSNTRLTISARSESAQYSIAFTT